MISVWNSTDKCAKFIDRKSVICRDDLIHAEEWFEVTGMSMNWKKWVMTFAAAVCLSGAMSMSAMADEGTPVESAPIVYNGFTAVFDPATGLMILTPALPMSGAVLDTTAAVGTQAAETAPALPM